MASVAGSQGLTAPDLHRAAAHTPNAYAITKRVVHDMSYDILTGLVFSMPFIMLVAT